MASVLVEEEGEDSSSGRGWGIFAGARIPEPGATPYGAQGQVAGMRPSSPPSFTCNYGRGARPDITSRLLLNYRYNTIICLCCVELPFNYSSPALIVKTHLFQLLTRIHKLSSKCTLLSFENMPFLFLFIKNLLMFVVKIKINILERHSNIIWIQNSKTE